MEMLVQNRARVYLGACGDGRARKLILRLAAPILIAFCMVSCGGGGGGSTPTSGSGGNAPPPVGGPPAGAPPPNPSFTAPTFTADFMTFPGDPMAVVAADMDNDGRMDIVLLTADHFATGAPASKAVHVLYQRAGGFDVKSTATAPIQPEALSVAACDIDGDGRKEILVGFNGGDLTIHKLATDGTPLAPTTLPGLRSFTIDCVDLDGDGLSDVVTSGKVGFDVQVLLQRNGNLTEVDTFASTFPATLGFSSVGDINGDGKPDLLFTGFDSASQRQVFVAYLQIGGGRFIPAGTQSPPRAVVDFPLDPNGTGNALGINGLAILDLFANGTPNIVAAVGGNQPASHITIAAYASDGQLLSTSSFPTSDIPTALRVTDIDGDGRNDIVVYHNGHSAVGVHYQDLNGSFRQEQRLFIAGFADSVLSGPAIAIGDFDSNGKRDIVLASQSALFFFLQD